ncbi:MAG: hypothetical protein KF729_30465 [Sandaracinaceae bacterium]|nr:hypothetical protein [Sandaracinaceae bacterium]
MRFLRSLSFAALLALPACVATPQPNPPLLDPDRLASGTTRGSFNDLVGGVGAIDPPEATLRITPLDATRDPVLVTPRADGSFEVALEWGRHRLQPQLDGARGPIVDITLDAGLVVLAPRPACLRAPLEQGLPDTPIGATGEASVELANDCAGEVLIEQALLRGPSRFEVLDAPARIAPGAVASVRVRFAPDADRIEEEVLRLDVREGALEQRFVTLFGAGTR